jgi:hypothetical protein
LGGGGEEFEVEGFPEDRGEAVGEDGVCLAVPEAGDDEDARGWTESADGEGLFDGGDGEPIGTFGGEPGGTEFDRVAVGIGFDDGNEGGGWTG